MPDYIGDNHLSQGCGRQRGNTDAAAIIIAVLIIVPGTSAAIAPLLSTRRNPRWFAVSGFVRVIPPCVLLFRRSFILSARRKYDCYIKIRKIFELCKCGARLGDEKKKDTGYPSRCPTTKSTIKIILTAIPYAKLVFYSHLHNRITTR